MWFYKDQLFDSVLEEFDSFVYLITRLNILEDDKSPIYYVGKKSFYSKGKYKGKRIISESDWWDYFGSSEDLTNDIIKYGKHCFKREILHLCRTKGDAGYLEAKEQIERNVLYKDGAFKLYYNKNILGRYRCDPEYYLLDGKLEDYFNLDVIHGNNFGKIAITNSSQNRIVSKAIAKELVESGSWLYGKCEKHIEVNDGVTNFLIPKSSKKDFHILGWIKKYVTNGVNDKFIPIHLINEYIKQNPTWYIGYSKNNNDIWITDGVIDKKINKNKLDEHAGFFAGRSNNGVKNKISIFKNDEFKWVFESDLDKYINNGWSKKGRTCGHKQYTITNNINQKHFRSEEEKNDFLSKNTEWRDGQLHRESFNTIDTVFAKDMRTDEKVTVSKDEYKTNKYLTSVKTKKVKIKQNNRIIFTGYLDLFLIHNPKYPKLPFSNALRSESGNIILNKGKNKFLTDEKLNIKYL